MARATVFAPCCPQDPLAAAARTSKNRQAVEKILSESLEGSERAGETLKSFIEIPCMLSLSKHGNPFSIALLYFDISDFVSLERQISKLKDLNPKIHLKLSKN